MSWFLVLTEQNPTLRILMGACMSRDWRHFLDKHVVLPSYFDLLAFQRSCCMAYLVAAASEILLFLFIQDLWLRLFLFIWDLQLR
jgi:hypothetical protein